VISSPIPAGRIADTERLETLLSEPSDKAVEVAARLEGDLIILGVSGKMGPTLARMAKEACRRAGVNRRIIGVSRFSDSAQQTRLEAHGIETIGCDLLDPAQLAGLPEVANVLYLAGTKFGTTGQEARTWAMNCWLPGMVCQKFRHARIVALSTGNVYGLTPVARGGSVETDGPCPVGDYAMSCLGRERIFTYFNESLQIPLVLLRLNYATEMRYGVLVDLAQQVWLGQPIDLTSGHFNAIWQADANAMVLAALGLATVPPLILNVAGPELLSVRRVAEQFGHLLDKPAIFRGTESTDALLSNGQEGHRLLGYPRIGAEQMIGWIADWIERCGQTFGKPTHFGVRDGRY
jgi:nucleoside-diphosphate-sugar epimerase